MLKHISQTQLLIFSLPDGNAYSGWHVFGGGAAVVLAAAAAEAEAEAKTSARFIACFDVGFPFLPTACGVPSIAIKLNQTRLDGLGLNPREVNNKYE